MKSVRVRSFSGPYSVRMQENKGQENFEYGHFLRSVVYFFTEMKVTFVFAVILLFGLTYCEEENFQNDSENTNVEDSSEIEDILGDTEDRDLEDRDLEDGDLEDPTRKKNCKLKVNCISCYSYKNGFPQSLCKENSTLPVSSNLNSTMIY